MKQIVKRYIKWMIITLILLSIFKCSSSGDNTNKTVLKVFTQPRWAPYLKKAQLKWDKIHPQNRIKLQILELGYPQLRSKLITAAGGDNAPDFSLIDVVWIAEFVEAGYLKSIDELDSAWVDTVFCQDWYQSLVNAVSYQNHIYGLVTQTGTEHLYYRRDWFWQEGIEPPETWQQLIDVATHFQQDFIRKKYKLGDHAMDLLGGVRGGESTAARWLLSLWSANGKIFDKYNGVIFDDFPARMALELYYDLIHKYKVVSQRCITWDWQHPRKLFGAGKIALFVGGSYEWTMLQKQTGWDDQTMREKIGFIPFPAATVGQKVVGTGGMAYCIFKQSHNQKLALEFLKKVLSDQLLSNFCITTNQTPPRKSVVASLDSSKHWFLWKNAQMLKWARSRPTSPIYPKFSEQIQKMLELTISREIDPYSAVSNVEKEMKNELINLNTPQ
jgi:multiple sugar transport system substrate-binding protein